MANIAPDTSRFKWRLKWRVDYVLNIIVVFFYLYIVEEEKIYYFLLAGLRIKST